MQYIDAKFKDSDPVSTVEKIKKILETIDVSVEERWSESGLDDCHSVHVNKVGSLPGYNGKGVSKEFARASAYAEFIERLQSGIYLKGYQSIRRDPTMEFHRNAPDKRYMTVEELASESEWMDYLIAEYKDMGISRDSLASLCADFACADDGKVLTIPYYSLFEKKYVYIPAAFVDHMYSSNGICAGNTREEAWVHGMSEIMERYASQKMLISGKPAPRISEETLNMFPTVSRILKQVRESGQYDITIFDYSIGNGFPVVSSRIINKKDQNYHINVAADPVLEIAVQRTLTELFQGRSTKNMVSKHNGRILNRITDYPIEGNVTNQLHTSDGLYTADYFADEITCDKTAADLTDNSNKNNTELMHYMLDLFRQMNKPVYVRNYSFLGFHCYQFVVPGVSETNYLRLNEIVSDHSLADSVREIYKNPAEASNDDLQWMLNYYATTGAVYAKRDNFAYSAGMPMTGTASLILAFVTRAYAAYKLGHYQKAIEYLHQVVRKSMVPEKMRNYFACTSKYLELKLAGISEEKIRSDLYK